jgi:hypothetical protein
MRTILAFLVAVLVTFTLASVASTQLVLNELASLGAPVTLGLRASQSLADWIGLAGSGAVPGLFPGIVAIGFLIAFVVASLVTRLAPALRGLIFTVAGGAAMAVIFLALESSLGTRGLFGARGGMGLAFQVMAGLAGGVAFAAMTRQERA